MPETRGFLTVRRMHDIVESIFDSEVDAGHNTGFEQGMKTPVGIVANFLKIRELPNNLFTYDEEDESKDQESIPLFKPGYLLSSAVGEGPFCKNLAATISVGQYGEFSGGSVIKTAAIGEFFRIVNALYEYENENYDRDSALVYCISEPINIKDDDEAMVKYMSETKVLGPDNDKQKDAPSAEIWLPVAVTGETAEAEIDEGATETFRYYVLHLMSIRDVISGVMANDSLSRAFLMRIRDETDDRDFQMACTATLLHGQLVNDKSGGSYNEQFGIEGIDWKQGND